GSAPTQAGQEGARGTDPATVDHSAMAHGPAPAQTSSSTATGHAGVDHSAPSQSAMDHAARDHAVMDHGSAHAGTDERVRKQAAGRTALPQVDYGMGKAVDMAGMDHGSTGGDGGMDMFALAPEGEFDGSGRVFGWASGAPHGSKVLSYADLRSEAPQQDLRPAERELIVRLSGNMERYIWTLNGAKFGEAEPFQLRYGERVKLTFVNETMMAHPMHLHGMFMQLDNGQPAERLPDKNVVSVAPGKTYSVLITADQAGEWAFHCHLLYHMESGMMQKVVVARLDGTAASGTAPAQPDPHAGHGGGS
ncbi:MAG: multicopper oxidase domain-containing protein, partial [Proteobacteria bacterium]|nr:multicopper oxidase domain-containing protein [Pseudomonadota bacterium]